jgi:leucine dehydrogenase
MDTRRSCSCTTQVRGLRAIVAIHSLKRGPALDGCRMFPYSTDADAIPEVLRLSRGMSYKAAAAGVAFGVGKAVIIGDSRRDKTRLLLLAMGRATNRLDGRYITGEDIGTNPEDMGVIRQETQSVSCLTEADGGYGDPAPFTALGVVQAIKAALAAERGSHELGGLTVAVQGVGNVGPNLCTQLVAEGAKLVVCGQLPIRDAIRTRLAHRGSRGEAVRV